MRWAGLLTLLVCFLSGGIAGFISFRQNYQEQEEKYIRTYLEHVRDLFAVSSLQVSGVVHYTYKSEYKDAFSFLKNPLWGATYQIIIPYKATYGMDLEKVKFNNWDDKIFVSLPYTTLQHLEMLPTEKKVLVDEGWLVWDKDTKLLEHEKKLFAEQKNKMEQDAYFKSLALEQSKKNLLLLLQPLQRTVVFEVGGNRE